MKSPNLRRRCTLYLADCMDALALIPDNAAALILTDPPYSSGTRREGSKTMCGNKERAILHSNTPWQRWITTDQLTPPPFSFSCARSASRPPASCNPAATS